MAAKRLGALRRIAKLYSVVEQMHALALHAASSAVSEADVAILATRKATTAANQASREALIQGDRESWMLADSGRELAGLRREQLERIRDQRAGVRDTAQGIYQVSRLRTEQIQQVLQDQQEELKTEEARRAQALSDDRFLTRIRWRQMSERE